MPKLLVLALLLFFNGYANANTSNCYAIQSMDSRNVCLAKTKHLKSYCYSVKNEDRRNHCLARLTDRKNYCYSIHSKDRRNQCLSKFN